MAHKCKVYFFRIERLCDKHKDFNVRLPYGSQTPTVFVYDIATVAASYCQKLLSDVQ
jgi:hypothetical protein